MSKKDSITKSYMQNKETFADACNFLLFGGRPVIKPESLEPLDPTSIAISYDENGVPIPTQKFRDILKRATLMKDDRASYLVLGIENQSEVDYAMPVRNMYYDASHYVGQAEAKSREHRKNGDKPETSGEFLSGFHKTDKLTPVITATVFFNSGEWTGPRSLHEMLDADEEILKLIPNYPLRVIVPADFREEDFSKLSTDFRLVMECLKYANDKRKLGEIIREDESFQSVARRTADVINVLTNSNIQFKEGEERVDMCEAIKGMLNDAREEGLEKGLKKGREEGREEGVIEEKITVANKLLRRGWTIEEIAEILDVSTVDVEIWINDQTQN